MKTKSQKSKRKKGNEFQKWIEKFLKERGYVVHNQLPVATKIPVFNKKKNEYEDRWISKRMDLFGCFDLIAVNEREIKFIQATLDSHVIKRLKEIYESFKLEKLPDSVSFEMWIKDKDKIRVKKLDFEGKRFVDYAVIKRKKIFLIEGSIPV